MADVLGYSDEAGEAAWDPPCGCTDDGLCVFDLSQIGCDTGVSDWDRLRRDPRHHRRERGQTFARACVSPDEYMKLAAGSRGGRIRDEYDSVRRKAVAEYAALMRTGAKFPVPVVEWKMRLETGLSGDPCCLDTDAFRELETQARGSGPSVRERKLLRDVRAAVSRRCGRLAGGQEGRHRALAAKTIGVRRIPVLIQLPITGWTDKLGKTLDGQRR